MIGRAALIGCVLVLSTAVTVLAQVRVQGYTRQDGTYVAPYTRTAPDTTIQNNYSYPGNYNPNSGQVTPMYTPPAPSYAPPTSLPSSGLYGLPRSR